MSPCSSSGVSIITRSAHSAAAATDMTLMPSASAFLAEEDPGRSATAISLQPESRMLSRWAWPWLP